MLNSGAKTMELPNRTEDNVTEVIYNWSIENFASLMNNNVGEGIVGERFSIDGTDWHFILHPNGCNPKSRHFISLWLFNDNREDLSIEYQVFIGEHLLKSSGVNSVAPGQRHGILQLVSHIDILEKNLMDKSGHLNLSIKLMMEMDVEVIEASLEEDFVNAEINSLLETSLLDPLKIEPSDHFEDELIQFKDPIKGPIFQKVKESRSLSNSSPKTYSKKNYPSPVINKLAPNIKSKSNSSEQVSSNSNIDLPSSFDLPKTTILLPFHKDNSRKTKSSNCPNPSEISTSTKQTGAQASPNEPVAELIKIILNLPLGDKVLFLRLLLLQLNNDMLSMVKKMVNTLVQERDALKDSTIDFTMRITQDNLNYGEEKKNLHNDEQLYIYEEVEDSEIGTIDLSNDIDEPFNMFEPLVKIHEDNIEEHQLEPKEFNLKKVDVRVKKLPVEMKEGIIVAKTDSNINEDVSTKDVQILGSNDAVNETHKSEEDNCKKEINNILEEINNIPNTTIIKESIENYVPTNVDFDHPYALKVEEASMEENELKYFCVKIVNHDTLYTCCLPKCNQVFKTAGELRKHKNRHIDLETVVKRDFKKLLSANGKSLFICDQCPQTFKTKQGWREHERRHKEETETVKNIQCDQCEMRFCSNTTLKSHVLKKHSKVVCDKCGHTARDRHALKIHNITKHSDPSKPRPFQCDQCPKAFYLKGLLNKHMRIHNGGKPFSCDQCNKTFHCRWEVNEHKASHGDERKHKCKECSKAFKFSSTLFKHIKLHHTTDLPYECDICLKRFAVPYYLSQHRRQHFPEANFSCDRCGATFKQKDGLKQHLKKSCSAIFEGKRQSVQRWTKPKDKTKKMKTNRRRGVRTANEMAECDICGKSLRRKNLKHHLLSHSSEKPFSCDQCGQSFATNVSLRQHVKIHSKPFSCAQCQKSFSKTSVLKYHMRTHTGEKPYTCDQCSKSFSFYSSWKKHKDQSHNCNIEVTTSNDNFVEETVRTSQETDNLIEEIDNTLLYQAIATIPM